MTSPPQAAPQIVVRDAPSTSSVRAVTGYLGAAFDPSVGQVQIDATEKNFAYWRRPAEEGWIHLVAPDGRRFVGSPFGRASSEETEDSGFYVDLLSIAPDGQMIYRSHQRVDPKVLEAQIDNAVRTHDTTQPLVFSGRLGKGESRSGNKPWVWETLDAPLAQYVTSVLALYGQGHAALDQFMDAAQSFAPNIATNYAMEPERLAPPPEADANAAATTVSLTDLHDAQPGVAAPQPGVATPQPAAAVVPPSPAAAPQVPGVPQTSGVPQASHVPPAPAAPQAPAAMPVAAPQADAPPAPVPAPVPQVAVAAPEAPVTSSAVPAPGSNGHNPATVVASPVSYPTEVAEISTWLTATGISTEHWIAGTQAVFGPNASVMPAQMTAEQIASVARFAETAAASA